MDMPKPLVNLITQARQTSSIGGARVFQLKATLITPTQQIPLIVPTGFARLSLFAMNHSDDAQIQGQLQPSVYMNRILPYRDNLFIEVIEQGQKNSVVTRYRAIPLGNTNPEMIGQNTAMNNLEALDANNIITVTFQLLEPGFDKLKNEFASNTVFYMGKLADIIHDQLTKAGQQLQLTNADRWRGVDMELPIDNERVFKQVIIPQGTKLIKVPEFLQNDNHYGVYSKGMGSYYRKGMWYIYPLFKLGRHAKARKALDIYRMPENVFPSLTESFYQNDRLITILSTGGATHSDDTDINRQNEGTGSRVINPDALSGEAGYYYGRGGAITTRQDSVSEYRTAERGSGQDIVPFHDKPTANVCAVMSRNAMNDGEVITVDWHNSFGLLIDPGMPVKFYYMSQGDRIMVREGTVLAVRSEYTKDDHSTKPTFREHTKLELFLTKRSVPASV